VRTSEPTEETPMTTPIVLLILLTAPYLFARLLASSGRRGPDLRTAAAVGLGLVFLLTASGHFPANIYAALNQVPMGGHAWGPVYLLVRAPLQLILVVWAWWFTLRPAVTRGAAPERRAGAARS
jgi:uncharacterized membrane protein